MAAETKNLDKWLRRLRGIALFTYIASLCLAVAITVIALIPGSPVLLDLPVSMLTGLDGVGGVAPGVAVDPEGRVVMQVLDPTLVQRLLNLITVLPALALVAIVAWRLSKLLGGARHGDPFTTATAGELARLGRITAFGGLGLFAIETIAKWALSATMLSSGAAVQLGASPAGWLGVGLVFAAFAQILGRGVAMRAELDTVI